jgi:putative addiction module component (TIGR02574 family)
MQECCKARVLQMNKALLRRQLMELSPAERLELAEGLSDSVASEDPPLTDEQKRELDRRWAEHQKNPDRASPWEEVRACLWARHK